MNSDPALIASFVAVAEELHFARAAERRHLDPSALSRQIRQLEARLGVPLFDRGTRSVRLTVEGEALLAPARALLGADERFRAVARGEQRRAVREVRVGFMTHAAGDDVVAALGKVRADVPDITVTLTEGTFDDTSAGVRSGANDLAIVVTPLDDHGLTITPLFELPMQVFVSAAHRFAERAAIPVEDLLEEPLLVAPSSDRVFYDFWTLDAFRHGTPFDVVYETHTPEAGLMEIAAGRGVGIGATARDGFTFAGVAMIPIAGAPTCGVALVRRRDNTRPDVLTIADHLRAAIG